MKSPILYGSLAYDNILSYDACFEEHSGFSKHNVNLLASSHRREFGGCAGNIAYNLHSLGANPIVVGVLGVDGKDYLQRLSKISPFSQIHNVTDDLTAQAFIMGDTDGNQINIFNPGALKQSARASYLGHFQRDNEGRVAIVSPEETGAMLFHLREAKNHGCYTIFDPGQMLPTFTGLQLKCAVEDADCVIVNEIEADHLRNLIGGWGFEEMTRNGKTLVVTLGAGGSEMYRDGKHVCFAEGVSVEHTRVVDATGCGDAFRGGFIYALLHGMSDIAALRLGNVLGALKVQHTGGQNHPLSKEIVAECYTATYGLPSIF